jgi:hypothetical protein
MPNILDQYRQAKQDILKLHGAAKKELIARFNELANELLLVQKELREEFGVKMSVPSKPKTSRDKKAVPAAKNETGKAPIESVEVSMLEKKLTAQKRKLEEASKNGKPEKPIKDRIYELEDELRLARDR